MSGEAFEADWLDLRAPFDAAAAGREPASGLTRRFGAALRRTRERGPLTLFDLGGGTGANVCRLAPRIPGSQHWTVIDSDPALLANVAATVAAWGRKIGAAVVHKSGAVTVTTPQRIVSVTTYDGDLRDGLERLPLADAHGVTGSALLDLVSSGWLASAAGTLAAHRLPALFTLNVDEVLQWQPAAALDARIAGAFHRDLARDKGFGLALGHRAATAAAAAFAAHGYAVETARADWHIGAADTAMHRALLSFIVPAALAQPPDTAAAQWPQDVEHWAAAKAGLIDAGGLELTLGHLDLLAVS
jgi:hypothetical protein